MVITDSDSLLSLTQVWSSPRCSTGPFDILEDTLAFYLIEDG